MSQAAVSYGSPASAPAKEGNLGWVRIRLRESTQDPVLCDPNGLDAHSQSADRFINDAILYLEREMKDLRLLLEEREYEVKEGMFRVELPKVRAVHRVYIRDEMGLLNESQLRRREYPLLRKRFPQPWSQLTRGRPLYYLREKVVDKLFIMPPANGDYQMAVVGAWWSDRHNTLAQESLWTRKYWQLLVMAAHMKWADAFGKRQEFDRLEGQVQGTLQRLHDDLIDEDMDSELFVAREDEYYGKNNE
ncbi:MAG TPA: hypothetical protein VLH56_08535 [Dissulfurispiraceae bacterium]|nr:hypothetical protein [Dissulfurispiraceae bacterium]